jgi:hypothetical protein
VLALVISHFVIPCGTSTSPTALLGDRHQILHKFMFTPALFAFAGGICNYFAVKMLFTRLPLMYGSGVIPRRFEEVREAIKETVVKMFFDAKFLERYLSQKVGLLLGQLKLGPCVCCDSYIAEDRLRAFLESDAIDSILDSKIRDLSGRSEGVYLTMIGLDPEGLKASIKPLVAGIASEVAPTVSHWHFIADVCRFSPWWTPRSCSISRQCEPS